MSAEPTTHHFAGGSVIRCWRSRRHVQTTLPDGSTCEAAANDSAEDIARARSLGYSGNDLGYGGDPDPTLRMTVEHEIAHTRLAEYFGEPYSETLHAVAHHQPVPSDVADDEAIVLALQRFGRDGTWHHALTQLGEADAAGLALDVRRIADALLFSGEG